eukprot:c43647_g1_i1 orf=267-575(+)
MLIACFELVRSTVIACFTVKSLPHDRRDLFPFEVIPLTVSAALRRTLASEVLLLHKRLFHYLLYDSQDKKSFPIVSLALDSCSCTLDETNPYKLHIAPSSHL